MKKIRGLSIWLFGAVLSVAAGGALMGPLAHAQTQWSDHGPQAVAAVKKPPPPPPLQIAGSWTGTIQDSHQGPGTVSLILTEEASKTKGTLKGSWSISFPSTSPEGAFTDVGTLTGSVTATAAALTFAPVTGDSLGKCKLVFTSIQATAESINGTYRFTACSSSNTGTITIAPGPQPSTVAVNIGDDLFAPNKLTISRGQTVRWTNRGNEQHSVNSNPGAERCKPTSGESIGSPLMNPKDAFEHTFNSPGTFAYHCEVHGCMMKGTVTVQ